MTRDDRAGVEALNQALHDMATERDRLRALLADAEAAALEAAEVARLDERERLSARAQDGRAWCPTCGQAMT